MYHLICQDAIDAVVVQMNEPVQALQLVLPHGAAGDDGGLGGQAVTPLHQSVLLLQHLFVLSFLRELARMPPPAWNLRDEDLCLLIL